MNADYEDRLYQRLVNRVIDVNSSEQDTALALLHASHQLVKPRVELFAQGPSSTERQNASTLRERFFNSGDLALIEGSGFCGSYTHVLARTLNAAGIQVRIAQMKCGETWGCHILLEAKIDGHWAVLDPSFDMAYFKANGRLASFKEVGANWPQYRATVPNDYPGEYQYQDVRYTNWTKIPWIMPAIKATLDRLRGSDAEPISIRAYILNLYRTYLWMSIVCLSITLGASWRMRAKF